MFEISTETPKETYRSLQMIMTYLTAESEARDPDRCLSYISDLIKSVHDTKDEDFKLAFIYWKNIKNYPISLIDSSFFFETEAFFRAEQIRHVCDLCLYPIIPEYKEETLLFQIIRSNQKVKFSYSRFIATAKEVSGNAELAFEIMGACAKEIQFDEMPF